MTLWHEFPIRTWGSEFISSSSETGHAKTDQKYVWKHWYSFLCFRSLILWKTSLNTTSIVLFSLLMGKTRAEATGRSATLPSRCRSPDTSHLGSLAPLSSAQWSQHLCLIAFISKDYVWVLKRWPCRPCLKENTPQCTMEKSIMILKIETTEKIFTTCKNKIQAFKSIF